MVVGLLAWDPDTIFTVAKAPGCTGHRRLFKPRSPGPTRELRQGCGQRELRTQASCERRERFGKQWELHGRSTGLRWAARAPWVRWIVLTLESVLNQYNQPSCSTIGSSKGFQSWVRCKKRDFFTRSSTLFILQSQEQRKTSEYQTDFNTIQHLLLKFWNLPQ